MLRFFTFLISGSIFLVGIPLVAHATGTKVGNGGFGVVCSEQSAITKIQLLDLFEAKEVYRFDVATDQDGSTEALIERLKTMSDRALGKHANALSDVFQIAKDLRSSILVWNGEIGSTLDSIDSTETRSTGEVCKRVQIAKWLPYETRGYEPLVIVKKSFWESQTNQELALFLVHEALHAYFIPKTNDEMDAQARRSAIAIRQMVAFLASSDEEQRLNVRQFRDLVAFRVPTVFAQVRR